MPNSFPNLSEKSLRIYQSISIVSSATMEFHPYECVLARITS